MEPFHMLDRDLNYVKVIEEHRRKIKIPLRFTSKGIVDSQVRFSINKGSRHRTKKMNGM